MLHPQVTNTSTGACALFEHQAFITPASTPTRIEKTVVEIDYEVVVHTSDTRGAGTDAAVMFRLSGASGETAEVRLQNGSGADAFARGAVAKFVVRAPDVGEGRTLTLRLVRHIQKGGGFVGWDVTCSDCMGS